MSGHHSPEGEPLEIIEFAEEQTEPAGNLSADMTSFFLFGLFGALGMLDQAVQSGKSSRHGGGHGGH